MSDQNSDDKAVSGDDFKKMEAELMKNLTKPLSVEQIKSALEISDESKKEPWKKTGVRQSLKPLE